MANYTKQDVKRALDAGLLSEQDADYMLAALKKNPIPAAAGTALGVLLGGGAGVARAGGLPLIGAGATLGGVAGGLTGSALTPKGQGVGSNPQTPLETERAALLQMLADPNADSKRKKQAFDALRSLDEYAPPHQQNYMEGKDRPGVLSTAGLSMLGSLGLGIAGSSLGGRAGNQLAKTLKGKEGYLGKLDKRLNLGKVDKFSSTTKGEDLGMAYGAGAGVLGGIPAGIGVSNLFESTPYEEPF